jgi:hypothetical protein
MGGKKWESPSILSVFSGAVAMFASAQWCQSNLCEHCPL